MKILFASYQAVMLLKGGPRTQILRTKKHLEDLGVQVTFHDPWKDVRNEDFDLVHLFGANIGTYHFGRELRRKGMPFVVTPIFFSLHSPLFLSLGLRAERFLAKMLKGIWIDYGFLADLCEWSKLVMPNTRREAGLLRSGLGIDRDKIVVVPNGVEERFYGADPSLFVKRYGINNFILSVGHIGPERKNVLRLFRALEKINHPAVFIGRKEETEAGRMCIREAEKNPNLLVLDSIPNDSDELASAYAASDVFALPSFFETPGIAALEAALAGSKIVITKYGGTDEYFGGFARYVEPKSVESIGQGIAAALKDVKNVQLREHIRKNFLWQSVAEQTLDAYKRVVGSH
jgi:glycosyltransferase involved in cell wall biosynthesis